MKFPRTSLIFIAVSAGLFFLIALASHAANAPHILVTWRAQTYAPADYSGKVLPIYGSPVTAAVAVISGGVPVSLAGQTINWYVNSGFVGGGAGKTQMTFPSPISPGSSALIEARIPDYLGGIIGRVFLPAAQPEVVIAAPYGLSLPQTITARPFFFLLPAKLSDFVFSWTVNGSAAQSSSSQITLGEGDIQNGGASLGVTVTDPVSGESASQSKILSIP